MEKPGKTSRIDSLCFLVCTRWSLRLSNQWTMQVAGACGNSNPSPPILARPGCIRTSTLHTSVWICPVEPSSWCWIAYVPKNIDHLAGESQRRTPLGQSMIYPANVFDSRLPGDKLPLGSSPTEFWKTFPGLETRNQLFLSLPLSFSSSSYSCSPIKEKKFSRAML